MTTILSERSIASTGYGGYLTLLDEMCHVLSLPDLYDDSNACLMYKGFDMRYPRQTEVEFVATHYGTAGGFHP